MNKHVSPVIIGWFISIIAILFLFVLCLSYQENNSSNGNSSDDNNDNNSEDVDPYWGVDSASSVDKDLYQCVKNNYGKPEIWGGSW